MATGCKAQQAALDFGRAQGGGGAELPPQQHGQAVQRIFYRRLIGKRQREARGHRPGQMGWEVGRGGPSRRAARARSWCRPG